MVTLVDLDVVAAWTGTNHTSTPNDADAVVPFVGTGRASSGYTGEANMELASRIPGIGQDIISGLGFVADLLVTQAALGHICTCAPARSAPEFEIWGSRT